ncbi:2-succinylbenzoyl-CoA synthetase (plasmid) [Sphingobium amiense]|uniref:2-succinylbenzoyl-CoA synthetase n=4 Tax=Sphingobium TaxID=165695 RepID=A0A1E1F896_9SPHN|nr:MULTISPECIES: AMP-binding protein [Sphingobium]BAV66735.1 2-succinylbenzoyl-CoA synthetase [Sphingobium cloacae]BBE00137.1 2-succinylbenzoyl-CoA synthetase [Sphingobium amiense]
MQDNIGLFLTKRALLNPEREAFVDGTGSLRLTFKELNERSNRLANAFVEAGVKVGERVGILTMNGAEFVESYFALAKIGAVVVPLNWRLVPDELEFILRDSGVSRLVFDNEFQKTAAELHRRGDKTDVEHWLQICAEGECAPFAKSYCDFRNTGTVAEPQVRAAGDAILSIMYTSGTTGLPNPPYSPKVS